MTDLVDLFNPEKRYLIGKKVIDLTNVDEEILIKIGDRILRCHIDGVQQQTINPFDYIDYNACYTNQTVVSTTYSTRNYFAMNTWQNSKINLDLYIHGEIRI